MGTAASSVQAGAAPPAATAAAAACCLPHLRPSRPHIFSLQRSYCPEQERTCVCLRCSPPEPARSDDILHHFTTHFMHSAHETRSKKLGDLMQARCCC